MATSQVRCEFGIRHGSHQCRVVQPPAGYSRCHRPTITGSTASVHSFIIRLSTNECLKKSFETHSSEAYRDEVSIIIIIIIYY